MKKITLIVFLLVSAWFFFHNSVTFAQQNSSSLNDLAPETEKVTDLIYSVDPKNNGINGVFLKDPDLEAQLYRLKGECYRCEFYAGTIQGTFTIKEHGITPGKKATLTIYTMDNLMPGKIFDPGPFPPGSRFTLARIKTMVIENQKGSFKVRTN